TSGTPARGARDRTRVPPRRRPPAAASSRTCRQRLHALLEVIERQRTARWVAADDRHRARDGRQHDRGRHPPARVVPRADDAEHALAETEHIRHARPARAEEDDDALVDRELRRADDDAAEAAEVAAGYPEPQRRPQCAFDVALDLERD